MKTLYIIGNGFDLYHHIPTSFENFSEWLKTKDLEVHEIVEKYLNIQKQEWNNLEQALANIDVDRIQEEAIELTEPMSSDDYERGNSAYYYHIEVRIDALTTQLKQYIQEWISTIGTSSCNKKLNLLKDAYYLNFNYTNTLLDVYGIDEQLITFIHGRHSDNNGIILGHGIEEEPSIDDSPEPDIHFLIAEGLSVLNNGIPATFKNTAQIIEENSSFFNNLGNIENIIVLGHSLAEVDLGYFNKILGSTSENTIWQISFYDPADEDHYKGLVNELSIRESTLFHIDSLPDNLKYSI